MGEMRASPEGTWYGYSLLILPVGDAHPTTGHNLETEIASL